MPAVPAPSAATGAPTLARARLTVAALPDPSGAKLYQVSGDTYPHRQTLKRLGGRWSQARQCWLFDGADPSAALSAALSPPPPGNGTAQHAAATGLREMTRPFARLAGALRPGPADTAAAIAPDDAALPPGIDPPCAGIGHARDTDNGERHPHYWGHRERLRQRFMAAETDALPDYELLELLLFYAIPRIDTKPLAKELLARFGSLGQVLAATPEQLREFAQLSPKVAILLRAIRELGRRALREEVQARPLIDGDAALRAYLTAAMAHSAIEEFRVLFLDQQARLIRDEVQQRGTVDHTPLYVRELVKRALELHAGAVILVHNHPSGDPTPSRADIATTLSAQEALQGVGITLHDHVIVGREAQASLKELGLL